MKTTLIPILLSAALIGCATIPTEQSCVDAARLYGVIKNPLDPKVLSDSTIRKRAYNKYETSYISILEEFHNPEAVNPQFPDVNPIRCHFNQHGDVVARTDYERLDLLHNPSNDVQCNVYQGRTTRIYCR